MGECRALVLIRFRVNQTQRCRNSLTKDLSLLENYHGRVCGIGESVGLKEGCWPRSTSLAVLEFETISYSSMWFTCVPAVKQSDWLGGVDIVTMPLVTGAPGKNYITITELENPSLDQSSIESGYLPALDQSLPGSGGTLVVRAGGAKSLRGGWENKNIEIIAWKDEDSFTNWQTSAGQEAHAIRHHMSRPRVVGCYLCPLKTDLDYHSPW